MSQRPYLASEDSALLRDAVRGLSGETCLEIGAGNCGTLTVLTGSFRLAVGTDLVRPQAPSSKAAHGNLVLADAATCFREEAFDLVVFNPPYLPSNGVEDLAVDGGRGGVEVPLRFLNDAIRVLKRNGRILMVISSLSGVEEIENECSRRKIQLRKVAERSLFFERIYVMEARRRLGEER